MRYNWHAINYIRYLKYIIWLNFDMSIYLWNYHHNWKNEHTHHLQKFVCPLPILTCPLITRLPLLPHRQPLIYFLSLQICLYFLGFHLNGIIQYVLLFVWFLSFSIIILIFIHGIECNKILFLFIAQQYSMYRYCIICLSIHLIITFGTFLSLDIFFKKSGSLSWSHLLT